MGRMGPFECSRTANPCWGLANIFEVDALMKIFGVHLWSPNVDATWMRRRGICLVMQRDQEFGLVIDVSL